MKFVDDFLEYELLDVSNRMKLEKWNGIKLLRPEPQAIWNDLQNELEWNNIDATYNRSNTGGGSWDIKNKNIPDRWTVTYRDLTFNIKLMGFKHTGLFPEQAYNWNYIREVIRESNREVSVLNLFAYTGAATMAAAKEGASVVHVDSSSGMVEWAKENAVSSGLKDAKIRYLVDDVKKFVKREIRRGHKYDIILMDPPSFGRGKNGEVWSLEKDLYELVSLCTELLSDEPLLFIINSYTTGLSTTIIETVLSLTVNKKYNGKISSSELGIPVKNSNIILPCGSYTRWEKSD